MWLKKSDTAQKWSDDKVLRLMFKFHKFKLYSSANIYKAHLCTRDVPGIVNTMVTKREMVSPFLQLVNQKGETQLSKQ